MAMLSIFMPLGRKNTKVGKGTTEVFTEGSIILQYSYVLYYVSSRFMFLVQEYICGKSFQKVLQ